MSRMIISEIARIAGVPIGYLTDRTDRSDQIAASELPAWIPERPQGIERNVVVTVRGR